MALSFLTRARARATASRREFWDSFHSFVWFHIFLSFLTRARARATASRRECLDSFDSFVWFRVFQELKDFDELRVGFACDESKLVLEVKWNECETTPVLSEYICGDN